MAMVSYSRWRHCLDDDDDDTSSIASGDVCRDQDHEMIIDYDGCSGGDGSGSGMDSGVAVSQSDENSGGGGGGGGEDDDDDDNTSIVSGGDVDELNPLPLLRMYTATVENTTMRPQKRNCSDRDYSTDPHGKWGASSKKSSQSIMAEKRKKRKKLPMAQETHERLKQYREGMSTVGASSPIRVGSGMDDGIGQDMARDDDDSDEEDYNLLDMDLLGHEIKSIKKQQREKLKKEKKSRLITRLYLEQETQLKKVAESALQEQQNIESSDEEQDTAESLTPLNRVASMTNIDGLEDLVDVQDRKNLQRYLSESNSGSRDIIRSIRSYLYKFQWIAFMPSELPEPKVDNMWNNLLRVLDIRQTGTTERYSVKSLLELLVHKFNHVILFGRNEAGSDQSLTDLMKQVYEYMCYGSDLIVVSSCARLLELYVEISRQDPPVSFIDVIGTLENYGVETILNYNCNDEQRRELKKDIGLPKRHMLRSNEQRRFYEKVRCHVNHVLKYLNLAMDRYPGYVLQERAMQLFIMCFHVAVASDSESGQLANEIASKLLGQQHQYRDHILKELPHSFIQSFPVFSDELSKGLETRMLQRSMDDRLVARYICLLYLSRDLRIPFAQKKDPNSSDAYCDASPHSFTYEQSKDLSYLGHFALHVVKRIAEMLRKAKSFGNIRKKQTGKEDRSLVDLEKKKYMVRVLNDVKINMRAFRIAYCMRCSNNEALFGSNASDEYGSPKRQIAQQFTSRLMSEMQELMKLFNEMQLDKGNQLYSDAVTMVDDTMKLIQITFVRRDPIFSQRTYRQQTLDTFCSLYRIPSIM